MLSRYLSALSLYCLLAIIGLSAVASPIIHLGVLDWRDESKATTSRWAATLAAIEQQQPSKKIVLHQLSLEGIAAALAEERLDYLITNPGHYVQLSQTYPLAPLATLSNPFFDLPQQAIGSVVLVPATRIEINRWEDLRSLTLGAVTQDAFGGFQLIWDELEQRGLNPERASVQLKLTGFPMVQLFDSLAKGEVDAIVVRSCLAEVLAAEGRINLADYRVVGEQKHPNYPCLTSSQLYPDWPFLSTGKQSAAEVSQVLQALLQPVGNQPAQWLAPLSYQPVYALFERLRLGPFASFPHNPLLTAVYQYRYPLLLVFGLLLLIFTHHIRVGYLVGKRSQELQQAMQESQQKQKELAHLSRFAVMGELAAGLAHELNQPLTAILNYAQGSQRLLQQINGENNPQKEPLIAAAQKIVAQGERAAEIIRNLRAFMRKGNSDQQQLDPKQLLQEVRLLMDASLQAQKVALNVYLPEKLPLIRANRVEFLQILINLVSNALDAMQHQTAGRIDIFVEQDRQRNLLVFELIDKGEGLSTEVEQRIFEPFFTTRPEGMGLGLSLSRTLAIAQGASLNLVPHSAGGACACLEWPLANE